MPNDKKFGNMIIELDEHRLFEPQGKTPPGEFTGTFRDHPNTCISEIIVTAKHH